MTPLACRFAKLDRAMIYRHLSFRVFQRRLAVWLILLAGLGVGCSEASRGSNTNSATSNRNSNGNANASAGSTTASNQLSALDIKEPERYGVAMTISIQETSSDVPTPMLTQQFDLAKLGADRRWAFVFPAPLGQVVYLEKSGLRYLVLFERKQYVELTPNAFGFEPSRVLIPNSISERLRSHHYEKLGLEPVNGRTAIKYRLTDPGDASTHMVFVDQETVLPLRSELSTVSASGTKSRVIVEARDVQLNPDHQQFDVPVGMKKVAQQEARQQVEGFANALRPFADTISGARSETAANASQSAYNKNAGRGGR